MAKRYRGGDRGLSITLFVLFFASWIAQLVTQYYHEMDQAIQHGEGHLAFWSADFWWSFGESTFENWQSEFLQLFTFVVLAKLLIHRGSPQSRDGDDEMKDQLNRIEERLGRLS